MRCKALDFLGFNFEAAEKAAQSLSLEYKTTIELRDEINTEESFVKNDIEAIIEEYGPTIWDSKADDNDDQASVPRLAYNNDNDCATLVTLSLPIPC